MTRLSSPPPSQTEVGTKESTASYIARLPTHRPNEFEQSDKLGSQKSYDSVYTCERVSSPLSSLQNAFSGSPATNASVRTPLYARRSSSRALDLQVLMQSLLRRQADFSFHLGNGSLRTREKDARRQRQIALPLCSLTLLSFYMLSQRRRRPVTLPVLLHGFQHCQHVYRTTRRQALGTWHIYHETSYPRNSTSWWMELVRAES